MKETVTLKELIAIAVRRVRLMIVLAVICALVLGTVGIVEQVKLIDTPANLAATIQAEYEKSLESYEQQKTQLQEDLEKYQRYMEKEQDYLEKSAYLKINPYNMAYVQIDLAITGLDENTVAEPVRKTPSSPIRLLTVGVVGKHKNQLGTIEAVRLLQQRGIDVELTVIGAPENAEIDRKVCATSFVHRISYIQKEELINEYRKADIFVLPSFTESFGLVYAEALTQGVPVVYSAGQGFDHQFPEGTVGYRVNAQSPEDIADGILRVFQEYDNLIKSCGEAASCFTRTAVCSAYEQFYRELIANKN